MKNVGRRVRRVCVLISGFKVLIGNHLVIVNPQALMDYGTVMLLEDKPNIKVSVIATTSTQAATTLKYT